MKPRFVVDQVDQRQPGERNAKGANGIPDTDEADARFMRVGTPEELSLDASGMRGVLAAAIQRVSLIQAVDVFATKNTGVPDEARKTAGGEGAAAEPVQEELIAGVEVLDDVPVRVANIR